MQHGQCAGTEKCLMVSILIPCEWWHPWALLNYTCKWVYSLGHVEANKQHRTRMDNAESGWCLFIKYMLQVHNREGNGSPLQYSRLENPMNGGAWWAAVHGVAKCQTWRSDFTFTFHSHALEKEMATHSSVLAWRIPGTGEPGGLPSMGLHRVGHDWSDLAAAAPQVYKC